MHPAGRGGGRRGIRLARRGAEPRREEGATHGAQGIAIVSIAVLSIAMVSMAVVVSIAMVSIALVSIAMERKVGTQ